MLRQPHQLHRAHQADIPAQPLPRYCHVTNTSHVCTRAQRNQTQTATHEADAQGMLHTVCHMRAMTAKRKADRTCNTQAGITISVHPEKKGAAVQSSTATVKNAPIRGSTTSQCAGSGGMIACRLNKTLGNSYSSTLHSPGEALSCSKFIKGNIATKQQHSVSKLALLPSAVSTNCTSGKQTLANMRMLHKLRTTCMQHSMPTPLQPPDPDPTTPPAVIQTSGHRTFAHAIGMPISNLPEPRLRH